MKEIIITMVHSLVFFLFFLQNQAIGFDDKTSHPAITKTAVENEKAKFKEYLINNLGFPEGIETRLPKYRIIDLLIKGSTDEDKEGCRRANHMHDPTKDWYISYMTDEPWGDANTAIGCALLGPYDKKYSNITWAFGQYMKDGPVWDRDGQDMGWDDARRYFNLALKATTNTEREANYAKTFQALGQVLHLLQDMAVPAHTRNDFLSHLKSDGGLLYIALLGPYQPFERYVKRMGTSFGINSPVFPSFTDARPTDYWDTDTYTGTNPSESVSIGLAEFSNPNYFSDKTISNNKPDDKHKFPYPKIDSANYHICEDYTTGPTKEKRKYISRNSRSGCDYFATINVWTPLLYSQTNEQLTARIATLNLHLDENVHKTYANELLPRAIGYSAGLLDYFFRGTIELSVPSNGVYSMIDATKPEFNPETATFTAIKLKATNTTTTGESMTNGTIQLVVKYKKAHADPFQSGLVETDTYFSYIVVPEKNGVSALYSATPTELNFDLSQKPIPLWATDVYLQIVYHGKLGNEDGAVAVGFKDISEPTPIDIYNNMDKICINNGTTTSWYNAGSPEAIAQVDTNQNGIAEEWDVYRHDIKDIYTKISSIANPQDASPTDYDYYVPFLAAGNFIRPLYILSDYQSEGNQYQFSYGFLKEMVGTNPDEPWNHYPWPARFSGYAIKNQVDYNVQAQAECDNVGAAIPCDIRYYPLFYSFRGTNMWGPAGVIFDNPEYPEDTSCLWSDL